MHNRYFMEDSDKIMESIQKGAFLTVAAQGDVNTMTIGWATLGIIWQRPILMIAVRDSRHTFSLLEKTDNFTVSVPTDAKCKKALAFCGSNSGSKIDKFKECQLTLIDGQKVASPILKIRGIHYECRIVYKSAMDKTLLDPELEKLYPNRDYHTLYFGEVLACYSTTP
jgi:flavin reductase (DIM6/NTAB) family NADH-FMN oxidoreductase RutF